MRGIVVLAAVAVLLGCDSPAAPAATAEVEFRFGIQRLAVEPRISVSASAGRLTVRGFFRTPCNPYEATALLERRGRDLLLRVVGEDRDGCPQDVVLDVGYQAVAKDLEPGRYTLEVVHEYRDAGWPREIVHASTITIP